MGNYVDQEMAQSQRCPDLETEATHPMGPFLGYQWIVAIYIKYIQCGINYNNMQELHLAAV